MPILRSPLLKPKQTCPKKRSSPSKPTKAKKAKKGLPDLHPVQDGSFKSADHVKLFTHERIVEGGSSLQGGGGWPTTAARQQ